MLLCHDVYAKSLEGACSARTAAGNQVPGFQVLQRPVLVKHSSHHRAEAVRLPQSSRCTAGHRAEGIIMLFLQLGQDNSIPTHFPSPSSSCLQCGQLKTKLIKNYPLL